MDNRMDSSTVWYLENIISLMPGNVFWIDRVGTFLGCNNNQLRMMGLESRAEYVGKTYEDILELENAKIIREIDEKIMSSGKAVRLEEPGFDINHEPAVYYTEKTPLFNEDGVVVGLLGVSKDITDLKVAQSELNGVLDKLNLALKKAESASKAKSEFIANMSHDVRTPITGVISSLEVLKNREQDPDKLIFINNSLLSSKSLLALLNQILDIARFESGHISDEKKNFSIKAMFEEVRGLFLSSIEQKKLDFLIDISDDVPKAFKGNVLLLHRVLINLVSNALKFTEKGSVTVSAQVIEESSHNIMMKIIVSDTGMGIPKDKLSDVFEKFTRVKPAYESNQRMGAGLGLFTVKEYLEAMNGEIQIDSIEGEGSSFICSLPLELGDVAALGEMEQVLQHETNHLAGIDLDEECAALSDNVPVLKIRHLAAGHLATVLLVEDTPMVRLGASAQLMDLGYTVDTAECGEEGVKKATTNVYDLIFMDIGLPGIDGYEATRQIRDWEREQDTDRVMPIIAFTAHADRAGEKRCYQVGMQDIVVKPMLGERAVSLIDRWVNSGILDESLALPTAATMNEEDIIDWKEGIQIVGSKEYLLELLHLQFSGLPEIEQQMQAAFNNANYSALYDIGIKFLGGVLYCNLIALKKSLKFMLDAIKDKDDSAIKIYYKRVIRDIRGFQLMMEGLK